MSNYKLTGRFYHRKTFLGLILYVEVEDSRTVSTPHGRKLLARKWYKKASEIDAASLVRFVQFLVHPMGYRELDSEL